MRRAKLLLLPVLFVLGCNNPMKDPDFVRLTQVNKDVAKSIATEIADSIDMKLANEPSLSDHDKSELLRLKNWCLFNAEASAVIERYIALNGGTDRNTISELLKRQWNQEK